MMSSPSAGWRRLLREPTLHFFALGALLFLAHRLFVGAPRTVVVTSGVKADLSRRYQDANGRPPSDAELAAEVQRWKVDEALSREARRERSIATIRGSAPSWRTRCGCARRSSCRSASRPTRSSTPGSPPTAASTRRPRATTSSSSRSRGRIPHARAAIDEFDRAIQQGKSPASLGRPVIGGNLTANDLKARVEPELAERIPNLAPSGWQHIETRKSFVLARVKSVDTGAPTRAQLGAQLIADWKRATEQEAVDRLLQRTVIDKYHFEEHP